MINKIIYENKRGISIELNRNGPLFLASVVGFDGLSADIVSSQSAFQDGISISKSILKDRLLTLNCFMQVDTEKQRDVLKRKLYNAFNPKVNGSMRIYTDSESNKGASDLRVVQAPVFKDDYKGFNELVEFQVQLIKPFPFFEDLIENKLVFGDEVGNFEFDLELLEGGNELSVKNNNSIMNIYNSGDTETPLKVVFKSNSNVVNPSIYNIYTKEFIKLNYTMRVGEIITVTTDHGNKRVESSFDGVTTNLINKLDLKSTFMWLDVGDNVIKYDADNIVEHLEVYVYYTNYYLGV